MEIIGQAVIAIMMIFLIIGAIASIFDDDRGFGREFKEGIHSIGPIFLPVAGIMALIPILSTIITTVVGPLYAWMHSDPSIAAGLVIAPDLGPYHLAAETAGSHAGWIFAFVVSFITGSTIIFVIPVGLAMLGKRDHKYMALGIMAGLLAVPVSILIIVLVLQYTQVPLRTEISTSAASTKPFDMPMTDILLNMIPIIIFVGLLALGLRFVTDFMVRAFITFGRVLDIIIRLALAASVVQYFTGVFDVFGQWPLAPIIADQQDQYRALEVAGAVGIMLAGAFPMVYAIRTWLTKPLTAVGNRLGFSEEGAAGILAGAANVLALFRIIPLMPARDKVVAIAFAVCAAFTFGDHLAFSANFQPNMVAAIIVGKLIGGVVGIGFAIWIAVPHAKKLEAQDAALEATIDNREPTLEGDPR
ncbi:ethanolamine utilization protein EutH [Brevibacterium sp. 'Marine']|uniref:ethanolamine utilization protein EutH n=1 Tax=Brevibacterium sp. 'Marine' TaxID=2725563 RepID=UPI00145DD84F|nr:ethanolamine utilization protein EutH [Brevibacterium sp. 'Marine']